MNTAINELASKIHALEDELEVQVALARAELHVRLEDGKVAFENAVLLRHQKMRKRLLSYVLGARPLIALTAPIIYVLIVPLSLLDLSITIYQAICFPIYGIDKVHRCDYLVFDRRYLGYLNALEKFNCLYCSYAIGLIGYVREIGSRTEGYWCPIKHARKVVGAHSRYKEFASFGDAQGYRDEIVEIEERTRRKREAQRSRRVK